MSAFLSGDIDLNNLSVAILGPGAVGGFLAAVLWRQGISVTCIAKETNAEILAKHGIQIESTSLGSFTAHPRMVSQLDYEPDILFITTKATTLREALEGVNLRFVVNTVIVPLLNGIEHMQVLRSRYGQRVVAASIGNVEVKRLSPDHIIHSTPSACITLASDGDVNVTRLHEIVRLLSSAGIMTELLDSEAAVLWGKLVRLNAVACTTSASDRPVGYVRSDPWWRNQLEGCLREGVAVALAEGVIIDPEKEMAEINALPPGLSSSMHRDITAGKQSELDAIAGAVVRAGARHRLNCPTIVSLIGRIQARVGTITTA